MRTPSSDCGGNVCCGRKTSAVGPLTLIGVGAALLANNLVPGFDIGQYWPVVLVILGLGLAADRLWKR